MILDDQIKGNPDETPTNAVVVRELFRQPHHKISMEFGERIQELLQRVNKLKKYSAGEEYGYDVENLALDIDDKTELTIQLKTRK